MDAEKLLRQQADLELSANLAEVQVEQVVAEINSLTSRLEEVERQIEEETRRAQSLQSEIESSVKALADSQQRADELELMVSRAHDDLETFKAAMLAEAASEARQLEEFEKEREELEAAMAESRAYIASLLDVPGMHQPTDDADRHALLEEVARLEKENASLQA